MPVNDISSDVKPIPTIAVALDVLGWLALGAALLGAFLIGTGGLLAVSWAEVVICLITGVLFLGFGGVIRILHRIEQAVSQKP